MVKKSYVLLVSCLVLGSCATNVPTLSLEEIPFEPTFEEISSPETGVQVTKSSGESLAEISYRGSIPAIRFLEEWILKEDTALVEAWIVPARTEGLKNSVMVNPRTGQKLECYASSYTVTFNDVLIKNPVRGLPNNPFVLCENEVGTFGVPGFFRRNARSGRSTQVL